MFQSHESVNLASDAGYCQKPSSSTTNVFSGDSSSKAKNNFKSLKPKLIATLTGVEWRLTLSACKYLNGKLTYRLMFTFMLFTL